MLWIMHAMNAPRNEKFFDYLLNNYLLGCEIVAMHDSRIRVVLY